jgi:hypothetical protein
LFGSLPTNVELSMTPVAGSIDLIVFPPLPALLGTVA